MEKERDDKLPFLDVTIRRKGDGSLGHAVYRKVTHTSQYLNGTSHHHPAQKACVLASLSHQAFTVSDADSLDSEKKLVIAARMATIIKWSKIGPKRWQNYTLAHPKNAIPLRRRNGANLPDHPVHCRNFRKDSQDPEKT
jgi:hypothetical protein